MYPVQPHYQPDPNQPYTVEPVHFGRHRRRFPVYPPYAYPPYYMPYPPYYSPYPPFYNPYPPYFGGIGYPVNAEMDGEGEAEPV